MVTNGLVSMTALLRHDETLHVGVNVIVRQGDPLEDWHGEDGLTFVAPQDWVALTGPCPTCGGIGSHRSTVVIQHKTQVTSPCPDCRDGRRIVPLYTECPDCGGSTWIWEPMERWDSPGRQECPACSDGRVLVGRGAIRVVPVLHESDNDEEAPPCLSAGHKDDMTYLCLQRFGGHPFKLDPLPVPGRDWGIVIDCVEVAP